MDAHLRSMGVLGVRDVNVFCGNPPQRYHQARLSLDDWPDDTVFSDLDVGRFQTRSLGGLCGPQPEVPLGIAERRRGIRCFDC